MERARDYTAEMTCWCPPADQPRRLWRGIAIAVITSVPFWIVVALVLL